MLIGFDAKRFFRNFTGLGNYSRFIINALSEYFPDNHYRLYTPTVQSRPELEPLLNRPNVDVVHPVGVSAMFRGSIWRTWGIGREKSAKALDVFHGLSQEIPVRLPASVRRVVTVHDLVFMRYPEFYNSIDVRIYAAKVRYACKNADRIIAISKQTAEDVVDFLGIDKSRIDIVYQGCHPSFRESVSPSEIDAIKSRYGIPSKYLLNVGTIETRKNALTIVKSLLHIPTDERLPLVIVGRKTPYVDEITAFISKHHLQKWVIFLHDAHFRDFPGLYQGAEVFIYPSLFEGFGIPLVEAIESRVPVITSSRAPFPEAAGPHAAYVDPTSSEELALAIQRIVGNKNLQKEMVEGSLAHATRFQPAAVAKALSTLYQSVV